MCRTAVTLPLLILITCTRILGAEDEPTELVLYTALRPANWDVFLIEGPGNPPKRLTSDSALDYNPVVSPDGHWLVFCSERRGDPDLFVMDLDHPGSPRLLIDSKSMEDSPTFSPDQGTLVFVSTHDGNADVFRMEFSPQKTMDLSAAENLTRNVRGDFNPAISPDGRTIAFSSDRDAYKASDIYLLDVNGSEVKRLTHSPGWDGSPAWSADGKVIYFYSERDGKPRIYSMDANGGNQSPITPQGKTAVSPAVMVDGRIAYAVQQEGKWLIESSERDGSDSRLESDQAADYWAPFCDPKNLRLVCHGTGPADGSQMFQSSTPGPFLVHQGQRVKLPDQNVLATAIRGYFPAWNAKAGKVASDEGFSRVVISQIDGSDRQVSLTPPAGSKSWRPTWSKDGQWLACSVGPTFAQPDESVSIWKFRPDGSDTENLTADTGYNDAFPDFSPDGKQIVFRSGRDGNHEIYLMDSDGKNLHRLTEHEAVDTMPAFSSKGDQVAFTSNRGGDYEIYLLQLEEGNTPGTLRKFTDSPGRDTHPKFSPDDQWLVFASERGGMNDESPMIPVFNPQPYGEIYIQRISDGKVVRLTHNKWEDGTPTWGKIR